MNVNENLVNVIRGWGGVFSRAFIYGFTLREEAHHGFDSSINLPGTTNYLFALQYKRPESKSGRRYRFVINRNGVQHLMLLIHSIWLRNVWYAFPLFIDTGELSQGSPDFLSRTYFANPADFPAHTFDENIHTVEIDEATGRALVFSDKPIELRVYRGDKFLEFLKEVKPIMIKEIAVIPVEVVETKLKDLGVNPEILEKIRRRRKLSQRYTSGFFTLQP